MVSEEQKKEYQDYVKEKFAEKIHPEDIDRYILQRYTGKLLMYCIASVDFRKGNSRGFLTQKNSHRKSVVE